MAHPLKHAESSARKFGKPSDYLAIHNWLASKAHASDLRHRAALHHSFGIFLAEQVFGLTLMNSDGEQVPVRYVGEQHVREDLGRIPTLADWLSEIVPQHWMYGQKLDLEGGTHFGSPEANSVSGTGEEGAYGKGNDDEVNV